MDRKRIYIECTETLKKPFVKTGIQRVVNNILNNIGGVSTDGYEVIPVVTQRDSFVGVSPPALQRLRSLRVEIPLSTTPDKGAQDHAGLVKRLVSIKPIIRALQAVIGFRRLASLKRQIKRILGRDVGKSPFTNTLEMNPVHFQDGDILVLLDSSWEVVADALKKVPKNIKKVFIIYDLIPILHPEFCDEYLASVFKAWFEDIQSYADAYLCISKTVMEELKHRLERSRRKPVPLDWFHLGSDFLAAGEDLLTSTSLTGFDHSKKNFLVVGTLEPRKNIEFIMDSFEGIWRNQHEEICLWIVGKIGWKVQDLALRIKSHPEFGTRLFILENLDDRGLGFLYKHATALIQASKVEGFGLPLVEALLTGLPVLASDIPIFKEILEGCPAAHFFSLSSPKFLAALLEKEDFGRPVQFQWLTWRNATQLFFQKIMKI